jgi:hypothetical protein
MNSKKLFTLIFLSCLLGSFFVGLVKIPIANADTSFGNTNIGASEETYVCYNDVDQKWGALYTSASSGTTIASVSVYIRDYNGVPRTNGLAVGIYTSGGSLLGSKVGNMPNSYQWVTLTFDSPITISPSTAYRLTFQAAYRCQIRYDAGTSGQTRRNDDDMADGMSDPFGSYDTSDYAMSIYATYQGAAPASFYSITGSGTTLSVSVTLPCSSPLATVTFTQGNLTGTNATSREDWTNWMGSDSSFGFLWTEMPSGEDTTQKGRGYLSVVYNDSNTLVLQRERDSSVSYTNHMVTQYTFWSGKSYFGYDVFMERLGTSQFINQPQVGIYPAGSGLTYTKYTMGYNATALQGLSAMQVTPELMKNQSSFYWQTVSENSGSNKTAGFILTYANPPWVVASAEGVSSATNGEIQYMHMWSDPADDFSVPSIGSTTQTFCSSYIIDLYTPASPSAAYQETKTLAQQLWQSSDTVSLSWGDYDSYSWVYDYGKAAVNRIGAMQWAGSASGHGNFWFKNTTTWGIGLNASQFDANHSPLTLAASLSQAAPNAALTNNTGTFYVTSADQTYQDDSAATTSTDNTQVWARWRSNKAGAFDWDNYWYTWGSSDKFNTTTYFTANVDGGITKAWTSWFANSQYGAAVEFTSITTNTIADYTIKDPFTGEYAGVLVQKLEGTAASVVMNSSGVFCYYYDNPSQQSYTIGQSANQKFMFWLHYGQITSAGQITGYYTNPTLADKTWYPPLHPINGSLFSVAQTGAFYNGTATFPKMEYINSTCYNLTSIATGTKTFTLFLNTTIFTDVSDVAGSDSFAYNDVTGNLTFTATYTGTKYLQISIGEAPSPPSSGQILFRKGFEASSTEIRENGVAPVEMLTGQVTVVTTPNPVFSGMYSVKCNGTITQAGWYPRARIGEIYDVGTQSDIYLSVWVYIKNATSSIQILRFYSGAGQCYVGSITIGGDTISALIGDSSKPWFPAGESGEVEISNHSVTIPNNEWFNVEGRYVYGANGGMQAWLNSELCINALNYDTTTGFQIDNAQTGIVLCTGDVNDYYEIYCDEFVGSTGFITTPTPEIHGQYLTEAIGSFENENIPYGSPVRYGQSPWTVPAGWNDADVGGVGDETAYMAGVNNSVLAHDGNNFVNGSVYGQPANSVQDWLIGAISEVGLDGSNITYVSWYQKLNSLTNTDKYFHIFRENHQSRFLSNNSVDQYREDSFCLTVIGINATHGSLSLAQMWYNGSEHDSGTFAIVQTGVWYHFEFFMYGDTILGQIRVLMDSVEVYHLGGSYSYDGDDILGIETAINTLAFPTPPEGEYYTGPTDFEVGVDYREYGNEGIVNYYMDTIVSANYRVTAGIGEEEPPAGDTYTLAVSWTLPTNTTYSISSVAWNIAKSGNETGVTYQVQLRNGTTPVGANQTTATGTWTNLVNGTSYKACVSAVGSHGATDYKTVMFTVSITPTSYTVSITVSNPQNITYETQALPVSFSIHGNDSNTVGEWNFFYPNGSSMFVANQSAMGTVDTVIGISENVTNLVFACTAAGDHVSDYKEVTLSTLLYLDSNIDSDEGAGAGPGIGTTTPPQRKAAPSGNVGVIILLVVLAFGVVLVLKGQRKR